MNLPFVAGERPVESAVGQPVYSGQVIGPLDDVRREVPVPGPHRRGVQRETQAFLASPNLLLRSRAHDCERHLRRNHSRELQHLRRRRSRYAVIQHELADDAVLADQRNEPQGGDSLGSEGGQVRFARSIRRHVGDPDRLRVRTVGLPWRVSLYRLSVGV